MIFQVVFFPLPLIPSPRGGENGLFTSSSLFSLENKIYAYHKMTGLRIIRGSASNVRPYKA